MKSSNHTKASNFVRSALLAILAAGMACVALATPSTAADRGQVQPDAGKSSAPSHPRQKTLMKRQWGVEVLFVRQASAGYMLEFRYKVLDPEKAAPLFERQTKPVLTHGESGARLIVPTPAKTGALRNSNTPLADHNYWMFFANPGKLVKPGDHVTIEIGDFIAANLAVEE